MTRVAHVVIGPERHGVVEHAVRVAAAAGDHLVRQPVCRPDALELSGVDVVHVPFTDRLFAPTAEASAVAFAGLADAVEAAGAALSVTLHDLPSGVGELQGRRARSYASVVGRSRGVVVNSWHELARAQDWCAELRSLRVIGLPIDPVVGVVPAPAGSDAGVLGFLYPDRGYETVLRELPLGSGLIALGTASEGHADLPALYAAWAQLLARRWQCTGYLAPHDLRNRLAGVAVPVAPNRQVSASASINTWLAHGRRPLVARSDYAEEFDRAHPGLIVLYEPDNAGELRRLIDERLADPAATVLEQGFALPPGVERIAAQYRDHFRACRPPTPVLRAGRFVVPANRWDLLPAAADPVAEVSVVVPYYAAQRQLDLVLAGLSLQTYPPSRLQLIVADDGSPNPPRVDEAGRPVHVVRQENRGFRAAAARNLGASVADGQVLLFLDGDTVPEPSYVEELVRLPSVAHDVLVVGRRRHADLAGMTVAQQRAWLSGHGDAPVELTEPQWLLDGYKQSENLLSVDVSSYRFVISAVLGIDRELFGEIGGFDAGIEGYGGEDWELAYRAYQAGAVLAHEPRAVAWHDGPEWADRPVSARRETKNDETFRLAQRIPDPGLRDCGPWFGRPGVIVVLPMADAISVLATARSAFSSQPDCGIWLTGKGSQELADRLADPRINAQAPPADVRHSARVQVELTGPADLSALAGLVLEAERLGEVVTSVGRLRSSRLVARTRRWPDVTAFRRHDRADLRPWPPDLDLGRVLAGLRRRP